MSILSRLIFILSFFICASNANACIPSYIGFGGNQLIEPIIKNVPKISQNYQIKYGDAEGPGKQVIGIYFDNTTDIETLRRYVKSLEFRSMMNDGYREVWTSPDKNKFIVLSVNHEDNATYFELLL
ncbi:MULTISPECIES: hypothetical protein [Dickeya]|uniref:hypothetical protein n=1 Tax=Dickeya TaxID=204037 RepID=UPI001E291271|nr:MULTISPECIES: hypothetical protein [Dickeya]